MLAIFSKELKSYFHTSAGYIFLGIFLFLSGLFFSGSNLLAQSNYYSDVLSNMTFVFAMLCPILTMRTIAQETHEKTDQLLLTSPTSLWDIVFGKFFASCTLFLIGVAVTFLYPLMLLTFGKIAVGEIVGSYVGFILLGFSLIALGIFISSLTDSQVTAAVSTLGIFFLTLILDWVSSIIPTTINAGIVLAVILVALISYIIYLSTKNTFVSSITGLVGVIAILAVYLLKKTLYEGFTSKFINWFSLFERIKTFNTGILSVSSIVYFITFTIAFLYLSIVMLDRRRWN